MFVFADFSFLCKRKIRKMKRYLYIIFGLVDSLVVWLAVPNAKRDEEDDAL